MSDIKELKEEDLENITGGIEEDLSNYYGEWKQIIYFKMIHTLSSRHGK